MRKLLLLSLFYGMPALADSLYIGHYICNKKQFIEISPSLLYIGSSEFIYNQTMKKPGRPTSDIFLKGNEVAIFSPQPSWKGHYSLNIRSLSNNNEAPYVADCVKR